MEVCFRTDFFAGKLKNVTINCQSENIITSTYVLFLGNFIYTHQQLYDLPVCVFHFHVKISFWLLLYECNLFALLQSEHEFENLVETINAGRPQCPVGLNTLVLPKKGTLGLSDRQPYVYLQCGHVHGQHQWGQKDDKTARTCPLCLKVSSLILKYIYWYLSR